MRGLLLSRAWFLLGVLWLTARGFGAGVPPWQRVLTSAEAARVAALENQAAELDRAGQYVKALPPAREALEVRGRVQGADHWQAINARRMVEGLQRRAQLSPAARTELAEADKLMQDFVASIHQGRGRDMLPAVERTLQIRQRVLGDGDNATLEALQYLALLYRESSRLAEATTLHRKGAAAARAYLGESHPVTARVYNDLANSLRTQGRYTEARPLYDKALAIYREALGEDHRDTAMTYNNLALSLDAQGRYADARPLYERAMAIYRKALGEDDPATALSYNNLAGNLGHLGRYAESQPLYERAVAIYRKSLGEGHPATATAYANLAVSLSSQGRHADAQPLFEKALAIWRQAVGEDHPRTAQCRGNLAANLRQQGRYADAQPLFEQALSFFRRTLGEDHPDTAQSYGNLAANLNAQGRYADAQPLFEKALAINRKALGEDHPDTAQSYGELAYTLHAQGRYAEAEAYWSRGAEGFARARPLLAGAGLERAGLTGRRSYLLPLAAVLARNGKGEAAWQRFEEGLARGTWDDLSARLRRSAAERDRQTALVQEVRRLDQLIGNTLAGRQTPATKQRREELLSERRRKRDELAAFTVRLEKRYGPVAGEVYARAAIQRALPADTALVGWVDVRGEPQAADPGGEHWAVVLRARGRPAWERLRGSGQGGLWTQADTRLPFELRRAIQDPTAGWQGPAERLRVQRLQPLAAHLAARDGLPAVRRLIVLPSPALAAVPFELCARDYTVSYAPSGTIFSYLRGRPSTDGGGMLALADPAFDAVKHKPGRAPLPPGGILVMMAVPNGNAARAGLGADDVLLRYAGSGLKDTADLGRLIQRHAQDKAVPVVVWRAGQTAERTVAGGPLGVALARQPARQALVERNTNDELLAKSRAGVEGDWPELPGTRAEAESLRHVCAGAGVPFRLLADSDASEQELDRAARSKELAGYRYIHLATHGDLNDRLPLQSAVILSRDHLPDALKQLEAGRPVYDGRLTAEEVLERWDLHAELVTLSACETALGKYEGGEGFVGFTQALLLSGARSVCLSLWKVDDTATALLMQRFYANLLGQRPGLTKPLGKAEALTEAKAWLRELTTEEAARQAAALTRGVARGKGRKPLPTLAAGNSTGAAKSARPYAHPYSWAAFVLVGSAD